MCDKIDQLSGIRLPNDAVLSSSDLVKVLCPVCGQLDVCPHMQLEHLEIDSAEELNTNPEDDSELDSPTTASPA